MTHRHVSMIALALGALLAGCGSSSEPTDVVGLPDGSVSIEMRRFAPEVEQRFHYGHLTERERLVVRDAEAWAELWDDVAESDGRLYVTVRSVSPAPKCIVTTALTAPAVAVRVTRWERPVTFVERSHVHECQ